MKMPAREARQLRLRSQGLSTLPRSKTPASIVRRQIAVQAQDPRSASLSLWARGNISPLSIEKAVAEARIIRTWLFRGTLHYVCVEDLRWVLKLLAPVNTKITARHHAMGLDEASFRQAFPVIRAELEGGRRLTRAELGERLERRGISTAGQRLPHILGQASCAGIICQGPQRKNQPTYVLLDEWVPPADLPDRGELLEELARRYLRAYEPAGLGDFSWWSGLPAREARHAWQQTSSDAAEIEVEGGRLLTLKSSVRFRSSNQKQKRNALLLPAYDNYILGYRDRSLIIEPEYARKMNAGGGALKPVVAYEGRAVGRWSSSSKKEELLVSVERFENLTDAAMEDIRSEVLRLGRFFAKKTQLSL